MDDEGSIEVSVHYDALGGVERYDYRWIGGDIVRFTERFLLDADTDVVRYCRFPCKPGDRFEVGPFKLRALGEEALYWRFDVITAIRDRGFVTDLRLLWHRFSRLADIAYRRLIVTLAIWRLAEYESGRLPTWRDVKALRWLASLGEKLDGLRNASRLRHHR